MLRIQKIMTVVACFGTAPLFGTATPGQSPLRFESISSGARHTCGLTSNGAAYCWGLNIRGELGGPSKDTCKVEHVEASCSKRPMAVSGGQHFTALAVGAFHSCGLSADDRAYCWGSNSHGQMGTDSAVNVCKEPNTAELLKCSLTPLPVAGDYRFASLVAGHQHTCGITKTGVTYCWGRDDVGQLGSDSSSAVCREAGEGGVLCRRTPIRVAAPVVLVALAAGRFHTCGLDGDGQVWCWGQNFGAPAIVRGVNPPFASLSANDHKICALSSDGMPLCWGVFQVGPDLVTTVAIPTLGGTWQPHDSTLHFASVAVGDGHICGLTSAHVAYCWGVGWDGQLGISRGLFKLGRQGSNDPLPVEGKLEFAVLSAGLAHTCGVASDGRAYCWGNNELGQLGDGSTKERDQPRPVAEPLP